MPTVNSRPAPMRSRISLHELGLRYPHAVGDEDDLPQCIRAGLSGEGQLQGGRISVPPLAESASTKCLVAAMLAAEASSGFLEELCCGVTEADDVEAIAGPEARDSSRSVARACSIDAPCIEPRHP